VEGYTAEKAKGRIVTVDGGSTWRADITLGHLTASETEEAIRTIDAIRGA
jgi:hypothetical protein